MRFEGQHVAKLVLIVQVSLQINNSECLYRRPSSTLILEAGIADNRRPLIIRHVQRTSIKCPWCKICAVNNRSEYTRQKTGINEKDVKEATAALFGSPFQ